MTNTATPPYPLRSQGAYWICQLAGWGLYTLIKAYSAVVLFGVPGLRLTLELLALSAAAVVLTHLLRLYIRRHGWDALSFTRLTLRVVAASLVLAIPLGIATQYTSIADLGDPVEVLQKVAPQSVAQPILLLVQVLNWAVILLAWQVIYFSVLSVRHYRSMELKRSELARALQLAELRLLKSQLNPHFLFNALNTVRSLIPEDPVRAQGAVTRLANTLRYTLSSSHEELVTLAQELEIVEEYLELEALRLEDRLKVERTIAPGIGGVRIPVMVLQTVVENAIKHGIAELPSGGVLRITAALQDDRLVLEVQNPRPRMSETERPEGIGLRNAAERLRLLFGSQASLDLDLSNAESATVRIVIPRLP